MLSGASLLATPRTASGGQVSLAIPRADPKKEVSLTSLLKDKLAEDIGNGRTQADAIAEALISLALSSNVEALKYLADRTEGGRW
jgi:hypothetical protein